MTTAKNPSFLDRKARLRRERLITVLAFLFLVAAWLYGYFSSGSDVGPLLSKVLPGAQRFEQMGDLYVGYAGDQLIGYAAQAAATGYGGPVDVLVGVNAAGEITGVQIVDHKETPGFFRLLPSSGYLRQFLGLDFSRPLRIGEDLDGVSGASLSAEAVASAIRQSVREIARAGFQADVHSAPDPIKLGIPEVTLAALFIVGFFAHRSRNARAKNWIRWVTLLTGMFVLGFIYNKPLTIANITSFLAGYWPSWRSNLYWYMLLGGIFFVTTVQGKNPYCTWFCPFGAVQESLASITHAKLYRPRRLHNTLAWLQRALAFLAILLGLAFRNPGAASFEPFGTLFDLNGSWPQWILLMLVLLASLVIYRPFCSYLCPLHPVVDYIGEIRRWSRELWRKLRKKQMGSLSKPS